jgi:hypothetical protein
MLRVAGALVVGLAALLVLSNVRAADDVPAGTYKVMLPFVAQDKPLWLLKVASEKGKATVTVAASDQGVPPGATVEDVAVAGGKLNFTVKLPRVGDLKFSVKLPKEKGGKMFGDALLRDQAMPAELNPTKLTSFDPYEVDRDRIAGLPVGANAIQVALGLLAEAEDKKATVEEVTAWADKAAKSAQLYSDRVYRDTLLKVAEPLANKETYAKVALPYVQMAKGLLTKTDSVATQKQILGLLADLLEKTGKADEAKVVREQDAKLSYVTVKPYPGRKAKSERAVLVELFTGAQCPPCVAADLAFDALSQTYKPTEVVLLQYHLHVPGPDPLTNADTELRRKYYSEKVVRGTPTIFFNGRTLAGGGGGFEQAQEKYKEYTGAIDPMLEKPARAKIKLTATRKGDKIDVKADVSDLEETGDDVRLRLVLVEESVDYHGSNKLRVHHHVVRAFPGGTAGTAMKEKTGSKSVTVDLGELKKKLGEYLDKAHEENPFPNKERPMNLTKLSVVAFVQNDDTQEVLQVVQVPVKGE